MGGSRKFPTEAATKLKVGEKQRKKGYVRQNRRGREKEINARGGEGFSRNRQLGRKLVPAKNTAAQDASYGRQKNMGWSRGTTSRGPIKNRTDMGSCIEKKKNRTKKRNKA